MFEPDTLLPEQFFTLLGKKPLQGEKRLLLAMLEDAVHCFQTYLLARKPHERRLFQEAEEWINSKDLHWFFSFENICEILNIHPTRLRDALQEWKAGQIALHSRIGEAVVNVHPNGKIFTGNSPQPI
ncbi:MAG: hypothetical protein ACRERD_18290 [Candidatus Binatia bacterium]